MSSTLANYRLFLTEFRRTFRTTGAILPSGGALARRLAAPVAELPGPRRILEVGPGTGEVTARIAQLMGPDDTLDLVELNERFVERLRVRQASDSRLATVAARTTIHQSAIETIVFPGAFDVVVSGLPLNNFAAAEVEAILDKLVALLRPGGVLTFFEYIAVRRAKALLAGPEERRRLRAIGSLLADLFSRNSSRHTPVFANIPPAWAHRVERAKPSA